MKKEMSAFDVRAVVEEMQDLVGSYVDKVFHWGDGNVLIRLNAPGKGKKEMFFKNKKWLYLAQERPDTPTAPSSFASFVRKHVGNARIVSVNQVAFDRIVIVELSSKDAPLYLIFEIFGGGNVLLVSEGRIMNCMVQKSWRHRHVRPGAEYIMPSSRFDPTAASEEEFMETIRSSDSDLVRTLATLINLGGQYAEEVCVRNSIDKSTPAKELDGPSLTRVYQTVRRLIDTVISDREASLYNDGESFVDVSPIPLESNAHLQRESRESFSLALDEFLSGIEEEKKKSAVDPLLQKLDRRIESQRETVHNYLEEAEGFRLKADAIYAHYQQVDELLRVLEEQSKKLDWDRLCQGAMKIPFVRSIDPAKHMVVAVLDDHEVPLDYLQGVDANASLLYQKGKEIGEKAKRAEAALKDTEGQRERHLKGLMKKMAEHSDAKPTKQFWFERYKWFISSGGFLVLAGRDARTNDQLVKKHLKEDDIYVHADIHGAPSVVVKDGRNAEEEDLREAATFALAQSKAWTSCFAEGAAYWVYPDQVSKTAQPGEFVPRGAFIVRGKRNYHYHLPVRLAVGEIEHESARKIMCGPETAVRKRSERYVLISPSKEKRGKQVAHLAREFDVPEEEVARILPPGNFEITDRRGFKKE
ncbi:MAG: hypothetical protein PWQ88_510 [Candidatus Methanomethylophilaceae archaeon]|nr:hypothetical protein [Candidatus Methanomethylophilaceae archaeon]MDI3541420.1 hypothetical protein [Candidatus Methanomethylophilaceae archaeon]